MRGALPRSSSAVPAAGARPFHAGAARRRRRDAGRGGGSPGAAWGGEETLIVVSSDLSHYLPYATARAVDRETVESMLALASTLQHEQACGATRSMACWRWRAGAACVPSCSTCAIRAIPQETAVASSATPRWRFTSRPPPASRQTMQPRSQPTRVADAACACAFAIAQFLGLPVVAASGAVPARAGRDLRHAEDRTRTARLRRFAATRRPLGKTYAPMRRRRVQRSALSATGAR